MDAKTDLFDGTDILTSRLEASAARNDRIGCIRHEQFDEIASSGILALTVPRASGGAGAGRFEYVLTEKGRDFFPTYLALKKWGDDWLAEPAGPQVVFNDRYSGQEIKYPEVLNARGAKLRLEDIDIIPGSGAVSFNRKRFGGDAPVSKLSRSSKRS